MVKRTEKVLYYSIEIINVKESVTSSSRRSWSGAWSSWSIHVFVAPTAVAIRFTVPVSISVIIRTLAAATMIIPAIVVPSLPIRISWMISVPTSISTISFAVAIASIVASSAVVSSASMAWSGLHFVIVNKKFIMRHRWRIYHLPPFFLKCHGFSGILDAAYPRNENPNGLAHLLWQEMLHILCKLPFSYLNVQHYLLSRKLNFRFRGKIITESIIWESYNLPPSVWHAQLGVVRLPLSSR